MERRVPGVLDVVEPTVARVSHQLVLGLGRGDPRRSTA
jgi:hypothetical protein